MSADVQNEGLLAQEDRKRKDRKERKKAKRKEKIQQKEDVRAEGQESANENQRKKSHKKRKQTEFGAHEADSLSKALEHSNTLEDGVSEAASSRASEHSPFYNQTSSFYLPISPICLEKPLEGLCAEHLSPLILTYHPLFRAVVLAYSNVHLGEKPTTNVTTEPILAKSIDEYAVSFVWVTVDFLLFNPQKGDRIEGHINLQDRSHVGLVCWNLFNASIERSRLPDSWTWKDRSNGHSTKNATNGTEFLDSRGHNAEDDGGHYVDGTGLSIEGRFFFRVKDAETSSGRDRGFLSIEGTMLTDDEEANLIEEEKTSAQSRLSSGRQNQSRRFGKGRLGQPENILDIDPRNHIARHRITY